MAKRGLWCVVLAIALAGLGVPAAAMPPDDPVERSIREASYRMYHTELLELARTDALDNDAEAYELAHRVYVRLQRTAQRWFPRSAGWEWEMHLSARLDSAWSAPGCKLMIGVSLVRQLAANEPALAFVIGHEIAHCVMGHTRTLIDAAVDGEPRLARLQTRDLLWMIDGDMRQVLRLAPVSRMLEGEADQLGMVLAADAGYDPGRMAEYFRVAGEASGPLAGSHASSAKRRAALDALLPVARRLHERASP